MSSKYSTNKNVQLLISLLKAHGIKRVIASPGTCHIELIGSIQKDSWFELYSCLDERGAAYMACGMAAETKEPVVITCTEATASRNYMPGLTEAFYRKLPVVAVTGLHAYNLIGQMEPQVIDRTVSPNDVFVEKVNLVEIDDEDDLWDSTVKINKALTALRRNGGGPVHINMPRSSTNFQFNVEEPIEARPIRRYACGDELPELPDGRIAVIVGAHLRWSDGQVRAVEEFCENHNAVVICDHSSMYHGKYRFHASLLASQKGKLPVYRPGLIIHIGELSGDYNALRKFSLGSETWRVSLDGEIRDPFKTLTKVFEMREEDFFTHYSHENTVTGDHSYYEECVSLDAALREAIPELPFSNMYVAREISGRLPENATIHMGMSKTIRAWSLFNFPGPVESYLNVGCRGIDGTMSALIGASMANRGRIFFGVMGDLTFFYDLNSLGNRDIGSNLRIILINNNGGSLFKGNNSPNRLWFSCEEIDRYIAAANHFGGKGTNVVKHYAQDLGFEYLRAENKEEFQAQLEHFLTNQMTDKPMLFEIVTDDSNEQKSSALMTSLNQDSQGKVKTIAKNILGVEGTNLLRKMLKKDGGSVDFSLNK